MRRATADRIDHAITAGVVLAAHAVVIGIAIQVRSEYVENEDATEPIIATLIQRPRTLSFGPVPIRVTTEDVVRIQRFAPDIPDIPVEEVEPTRLEALPQPPGAPLDRRADTGLADNAVTSSGHSGGGYTPTLVQRVVPKYPPRSVRHHEQGATRIHIRVNESGRVAEVSIINSSGHPRLDRAAVDAVRRWKFARMPSGSAPGGAWVATEVRFILYRYTYSRLGAQTPESLYVEEVKAGARDEEMPGGQEALARFIADVTAGNLPRDTGDTTGGDVAEMRSALEEWGKVQSIRFTGTAGGPRWIARETAAQSRSDPTAMIEVHWNKFEVRHEHATSEWLVAVDRDGPIWNARASRAPWL